MRQISWMTVLAVLALSVTGCGGGSDQVAESPAPDVAVSPATVATPPATTPTPPPPPGGEVGANGEAIPVPPPPGSVPPELIESTNANQRLQQVQANRADPFGTVSVQARIQPIAQEGGPAALTRQSSQNAPGGSSGSQTARTPGRLAPIPNLVGGGSGRGTSGTLRAAAPTPPPPPQPTLARAVQVMGVVQIGNVPHAIVQAPNEPTSRYVRVGQRLSNGEVLVKRIEMGTEPIVVLEQVGVEVRTAVGGGQPPASDAASTTASLPLPTVPVN